MRRLPTKITLSLLLLILTLSFGSCQSTLARHSFFAMDTYITVEAKTDDTSLLKKAEELVYREEQLYSRTFSSSCLYKLNEKRSLDVGEELAGVLSAALELYEYTDGAFSPFLGGLSEKWNIQSNNPTVPDASAIESLLSEAQASSLTINGTYAEISGKAKIDLGAIAKGASAERVTELLKENGVRDALIGFGGSISCIGSPNGNDKWKIGIKNPFEASEIMGVLSVTDCYIAVSGAYERYFERDGIRYHHILDPQTGYPSEGDVESTVIISKNGALSDALSTALFVMGSQKALEFYESGLYEFEAILILKDGSVITTDGISDSFEFSDSAYFCKMQDTQYNNKVET